MSAFLEQHKPSGTTNETVFTASKDLLVNITVLNRTTTSIDISFAIAAAATPDDEEWLEYEVPIGFGSPLDRTGVHIPSGKLFVFKGDTGISVTINGMETS